MSVRSTRIYAALTRRCCGDATGSMNDFVERLEGRRYACLTDKDAPLTSTTQCEWTSVHPYLPQSAILLCVAQYVCSLQADVGASMTLTNVTVGWGASSADYKSSQSLFRLRDFWCSRCLLGWASQCFLTFSAVFEARVAVLRTRLGPFGCTAALGHALL